MEKKGFTVAEMGWSVGGFLFFRPPDRPTFLLFFFSTAILAAPSLFQEDEVIAETEEAGDSRPEKGGGMFHDVLRFPNIWGRCPLSSMMLRHQDSFSWCSGVMVLFHGASWIFMDSSGYFNDFLYCFIILHDWEREHHSATNE
jgi:hypothetical protein